MFDIFYIGLLGSLFPRTDYAESKECHLGNVTRESHDHLSFVCPFSVIVIKGLPIPVGINWADTISIVSMMPNGIQTHISSHYLAVAVYSLWQDRNNKKILRI